MTTLPYPRGSWSVRRLIEIGFSGLFHCLTWQKLNRLQDNHPTPHRRQEHFSSLNDQVLDDLGLQRSEIRAAEYGIIPGDQALHHAQPKSAAYEGAAVRGQLRSRI
ncbi:MAG: hypothetical protein ACR2P3_09575 [Geminicoccaceae bacterium]